MTIRKMHKLPLKNVYRLLFDRFGPQHWWPGRTRLEIMVGAILTQNTAWSNVEKAIVRLRKAHALNLPVLHGAPLEQLADWIRPAGFFNIKARRLRAFTGMIHARHGGRLEHLLAMDTQSLRDELLAVNGIGPETADSMLLYAAERPVFVIDAYTRRFLARHGWMDGAESYDELARLFMDRVPRNAPLYNEYHALVVALGKNLCRTRPNCAECPLRALLPRGGPLGVEQSLKKA